MEEMKKLFDEQQKKSDEHADTQLAELARL